MSSMEWFGIFVMAVGSALSVWGTILWEVMCAQTSGQSRWSPVFMVAGSLISIIVGGAILLIGQQIRHSKF